MPSPMRFQMRNSLEQEESSARVAVLQQGPAVMETAGGFALARGIHRPQLQQLTWAPSSDTRTKMGRRRRLHRTVGPIRPSRCGSVGPDYGRAGARSPSIQILTFSARGRSERPRGPSASRALSGNQHNRVILLARLVAISGDRSRRPVRRPRAGKPPNRGLERGRRNAAR